MFVGATSTRKNVFKSSSSRLGALSVIFHHMSKKERTVLIIQSVEKKSCLNTEKWIWFIFSHNKSFLGKQYLIKYVVGHIPGLK